MDFFKFKQAIKIKIKGFIEKYEAAHQLHNKIQEFCQLKNEEEKKGNKNDEKLEKEKEKILSELNNWTSMNKDEPPKEETKKIELEDNNLSETNSKFFDDLDTSSISIKNHHKEENEYLDSSLLSDNDITPVKRPQKRDFITKTMIKTKHGFHSNKDNSRFGKPKPSLSTKKPRSFKTSNRISDLRSKVTPMKATRKLTEDNSFKITPGVLKKTPIPLERRTVVSNFDDSDKNLREVKPKFPAKLPSLQKKPAKEGGMNTIHSKSQFGFESKDHKIFIFLSSPMIIIRCPFLAKYVFYVHFICFENS